MASPMTFFIVNAGLPPGELNGAANNPFQHVLATHSKIGKVRRSKYAWTALPSLPHRIFSPLLFLDSQVRRRYSCSPITRIFSSPVGRLTTGKKLGRAMDSDSHESSLGYFFSRKKVPEWKGLLPGMHCRNAPRSLMIHSDRGAQYTTEIFRNPL